MQVVNSIAAHSLLIKCHPFGAASVVLLNGH